MNHSNLLIISSFLKQLVSLDLSHRLQQCLIQTLWQLDGLVCLALFISFHFFIFRLLSIGVLLLRRQVSHETRADDLIEQS